VRRVAANKAIREAGDPVYCQRTPTLNTHTVFVVVRVSSFQGGTRLGFRIEAQPRPPS
jgi:hypothetical protein